MSSDLHPHDRTINTGWTPKTSGDLAQTFSGTLWDFLHMSPTEIEGLYDEIMALFTAKAQVYQDDKGVDSCFHRGLHGLFHNLMRKADRIETVGIRLGVSGGEVAIAAEAQVDGEQETLYKTVRDLAVYCIHTMRWLKAEDAIRQQSGL